jgi:hypothetical protein
MGAIGSGERLFATEKDVENGVAGGNKNSPERAGTGQLAEQLYLALQSGDTDRINSATLAFEESFLQDKLNNANGLTIRQLLGDVVYDDVTLRSQMLSLAYTAAAVNGQTGRTLSDKDLAFFLQIVGFGATQDAQTAKDNLLSFVDRTVRQTDNVIQTEISQNRLIAGQYPLDDKLFTSVIAGYWDAPKDEKGNPNFLDPENYEFKNFYKRYGKIPDVVKYQTHKRRAGTEFNPNQTKTLVNPSTKLEEDLKAIENLY